MIRGFDLQAFEHGSEKRAGKRGIEIKQRSGGQVGDAGVLMDEGDAVEAQTSNAVAGAGNKRGVHFNSNAADSSQDRDEKGHVTQPRSDIEQDIRLSKPGDGNQVKDVTHGSGLVKHHLRFGRDASFFRSLKLQDAAQEFIAEVVAQAGARRFIRIEMVKEFGGPSSAPDLAADGRA